jgi:hypothetical protein
MNAAIISRNAAGTNTPLLPRYQSPASLIRPVKPLDEFTAIARHQHLAHGRAEDAIGRIMSAARQLKQAVSEKAGAQ